MLTIAWDVDDVLNNLMQSWLIDYSEKNNCKVSYENIITNPPNQILGIELEKYLDSLDEFRLNPKALDMLPNAKILNWLNNKGHLFHHIALSTTSAKTARNGAFWVMKHFYKWIHSYNIVPSYRKDDEFSKLNKTKKDFLNKVKYVDVLIDDSEKNIKDAQDLGIKGFLVSRPWNKNGLTIDEILNKLEEIKK